NAAGLPTRENHSVPERIHDDALVVRGGRNRPEDLRGRTQTHPSGVTGVSVECAAGVPLEDLAARLPHGQIGVTTAGAVRAAGGDVVRTSGRSPYHATLTGLGPETASRLLTPTVPNPARKPCRPEPDHAPGKDLRRFSKYRQPGSVSLELRGYPGGPGPPASPSPRRAGADPVRGRRRRPGPPARITSRGRRDLFPGRRM